MNSDLQEPGTVRYIAVSGGLTTSPDQLSCIQCTVPPFIRYYIVDYKPSRKLSYLQQLHSDQRVQVPTQAR
jgi:hypothetical protein